MLKLHVLEYSGWPIMLLPNQIAGFLKLQYLRNNRTYNIDSLHVGKHPLRLQSDHVILGGCCQTCLEMPKEVFIS